MLTFAELDAKRLTHGLTRKQVYDAAGLDKNVWSRLTANPTACRVDTLQRIDAALDRLIAAQVAA